MSGTHSERTALLVDQHPLWMDIVEQVVSGAGVRVVGKLTSSAVAERRLVELQPDLLITGIRMTEPDADGLTLVRNARERVDGLKVVVLSMYEDQGHIDAAFAAGASAYVVKTAQAEDITSAVRQAFSSSMFLAGARSAPVQAAPAPDVSSGLTPRELEILQLVGEGHSNAQVARTLWVTEQTVKFHLSNIYRKLNVANRTEASRWAQLQGLLNAPSLPIAA